MRNPRRLLLIIGTLAVALPTYGSAAGDLPVSSWPQPRFDASRTSYNADEIVMDANAVRRAKPLTTIPFDRRVGRILADEGDLFVLWGPSFEGADLWEGWLSRFEMDGAAAGTVVGANDWFALSAGRAAIQSSGPSSGCPTLSVRTLAGSELWSEYEGLVVADATTVFTHDVTYDVERGGCVAGALHARDAETGEERWSVAGDGVVVEDGVAYVGSREGVMLALDQASGAELWRMEWPRRWAITRGSAGGLLFVWTWNQDAQRSALVALDQVTHEVVWRRPLPDALFGLSVNERQVVVSTRGTVTALARADGTVRWRTTLGESSLFEVRGAAGVFYAFDFRADRWTALRGRDGSILRTFDVEELIVANGRIITKVGRLVTIWGPPAR